MTDNDRIKCKYKIRNREYFNGKPYCTCFSELCEDLPICDDNCQIYEDFKQLTSKTLEYEKYKKLAADFKDVNKQLGYKYLTIKKECEELKEENQELRNSLSGSLMFRFISQDKEVARYRKALEEIEEIVKDWYKNEWSCYKCRINMDKKLKNILGIINKAKGDN